MFYTNMFIQRYSKHLVYKSVCRRLNVSSISYLCKQLKALQREYLHRTEVVGKLIGCIDRYDRSHSSSSKRDFMP